MCGKMMRPTKRQSVRLAEIFVLQGQQHALDVRVCLFRCWMPKRHFISVTRFEPEVALDRRFNLCIILVVVQPLGAKEEVGIEVMTRQEALARRTARNLALQSTNAAPARGAVASGDTDGVHGAVRSETQKRLVGDVAVLDVSIQRRCEKTLYLFRKGK